MRFHFGAQKIFKNTLGIGDWIGGLDARKKFRIVASEDISVCFHCFIGSGILSHFFVAFC